MITSVLLQVNPNAPNVPDPLDAIIVATILLFILSTITEKFTELVRMYPGQFRFIGILFCLFLYLQIVFGFFNEPPLGKLIAFSILVFNTFLLLVILANTMAFGNAETGWKRFLSKNLSIFNNIKKRKTATTDVADVIKEREVTALSFTIGFIVCILFNANLFNFFDVSVTPALKPTSPFIQNKNWLFVLDPAFFKFDGFKVIGFALTAFFLAFGAKFFHDLLDNLLQVKNLRRKLNDKADFDFNNISEFDTFLSTQEKSLFNEFLNKQLNQPGVFFESNFDTKSVIVHISDSKVTIPDKLFYKTSLGKVLEIAVIKKVSAGIKTLSIQLFPSAEMANQVPFQNVLKGTLGYFVKALHSTNVYLLTCYHVVWSGHDWDHFRPIGREKVVHPMNQDEIGTIFVALKNALVDAVLIDPGDDVSLAREIEGIGKVVQDRPLNDGDINLTVRMRGNASGNKEGFIAELNKCAYIQYPDGVYRELDNLILIKTRTGDPFSQGGDSGALLVDSFGFAIGMIVAGDGTELSLAIPFSNLRDQLNIEILKTV